MNKRLKVIAIVAVSILFVLQLTALFVFSGDQIEDSGNYRRLAIEKAESNSFYPDELDEYSRFVANPGFINYLSIYYRISDSDKLPIAGNIVLVMIMAGCVFFIALRLFDSKPIAWLSLLLLAIFPTFIGEVLNLRSEILFTTLAYAAIALFLSDIKFKYFLSGVLLALANWVRPLGLVFLVAILLYMLMTKVKFINYVKLISSIVVLTLIIGTASYISSGHFVYQSVTGGVNLIMGANDDADGSFNMTVFSEGNAGYLPNFDDVNYQEKDSIWISESLNWIKRNPGRYLSLIPAKLFYMYAIDTYAFSTFYNNEKKTSGSEYIGPLVRDVLNLRFNNLTWVDYVVIFNQLIYMIYLLMLLLAIIMLIVKRRKTKQVLFLLSVLVLGTGMTIVTVGGARYHYPYLPIFIIMSSALINTVMSGRVRKTK